MEKFQKIVDFIRELYHQPEGFIPLHAPVFAGNEKKYLEECIAITLVSSVEIFVREFKISMADTLNIIKDILQSDLQFITDEQRIRPENPEVFRLWGDNSLIKELTGFQPQYSVTAGLEETCRWFQNDENLKKYKASIYNL